MLVGACTRYQDRQANLALLQQRYQASVAKAFAEGTVVNLRSQCKTYFLFCSFYGFRPLPATPDMVGLYCAFLSESISKVQTIKNLLNAVRFLHAFHGFDSFCVSHYRVQLVLRGLKRMSPQLANRKLPITPAILRQIYSLLDMSRPFDATLWAAFLTGFHLFLRKSNLVPPSHLKFDPGLHLSRGHFSLVTGGLIVAIHWSKTIQCHERVHLIPVVTVPGSPLCLVSAFKNMCSLIPAKPNAPAFLVPSNLGFVSLTHASLVSYLRKLLTKIGLNPHSYSGHSFRRGGASSAFSANARGEAIRLHGDWKSQAYLCYLDVNLKQRLEVSYKMRDLLLNS